MKAATHSATATASDPVLCLTRTVAEAMKSEPALEAAKLNGAHVLAVARPPLATTGAARSRAAGRGGPRARVEGTTARRVLVRHVWFERAFCGARLAFARALPPGLPGWQLVYRSRNPGAAPKARVGRAFSHA